MKVADIVIRKQHNSQSAGFAAMGLVLKKVEGSVLIYFPHTGLKSWYLNCPELFDNLSELNKEDL